VALSYGKSNLENSKRNLELNLELIQFIYSNLNETNIFQATFGDTEIYLKITSCGFFLDSGKFVKEMRFM